MNVGTLRCIEFSSPGSRPTEGLRREEKRREERRGEESRSQKRIEEKRREEKVPEERLSAVGTHTPMPWGAVEGSLQHCVCVRHQATVSVCPVRVCPVRV